jgi:hypothetical protein
MPQQKRACVRSPNPIPQSPIPSASAIVPRLHVLRIPTAWRGGTHSRRWGPRQGTEKVTPARGAPPLASARPGRVPANPDATRHT